MAENNNSNNKNEAVSAEIAKKIVRFMEADIKKPAEIGSIISLDFNDEEQLYYCQEHDEFMNLAGIYHHYSKHKLLKPHFTVGSKIDHATTINNNNYIPRDNLRDNTLDVSFIENPLRENGRGNISKEPNDEDEEIRALFGKGPDASPVCSLRKKRSSPDLPSKVTDTGKCRIEEIGSADVKLITYPGGSKSDLSEEFDDELLELAIKESLMEQ